MKLAKSSAAFLADRVEINHLADWGPIVHKVKTPQSIAAANTRFRRQQRALDSLESADLNWVPAKLA